MKLTKLASLLLVLALLLALFAGCAKTEKAEEPASTENEAAETTPETQEPAESAPAAQEPEEGPAEPAPEAPAEPEEVLEEGQYRSAGGILYPIGDGTDILSLFHSAPASDKDYYETFNDHFILPYLREETGVGLEFVEVSQAAVSEQFQLMIASGDYTELLDVTSNYSGSLAQAYVDEVIIDLTDVLSVNAPDYWNVVESLDELSYADLLTKTDEGEQMMLGFRTVSEGTATTIKGNCVRADWLEEMGKTWEDLSTVDGFTDALYGVKENHPEAAWNLLMQSSSSLMNCYGWDTYIPDITMNSSLSLYRIDNQVTCGWTSDGYYEYLRWFKQLYDDGIINADYYSKTWSSTDILREVANGTVFCFINGISVNSDLALYTEDPIDIEGLGYIYADENKVNNWGSESSRVDGMSCISITVNCDDPDQAIQFMNYSYTDHGIIEANYGIEGETYTLDAEGNPQYTDLILNSSFISRLQSAVKYYTIGAFLPFYNHADKLYSAYGEKAIDNMNRWDVGYDSMDRTLPADFALTTNEQDSITNQIIDCCTFGQEMVLKFIYGQVELNEENWAAYVDGMYSFGLQDVLDVNQTVLDAMLAGER